MYENTINSLHKLVFLCETLYNNTRKKTEKEQVTKKVRR